MLVLPAAPGRRRSAALAVQPSCGGFSAARSSASWDQSWQVELDSTGLHSFIAPEEQELGKVTW